MTLGVPLFPKPVRWLAVIGIAGFIFYASILTTPPATPIDEFRLLPLDKWRHLVAYATLAAALLYSWADSDRSPRTAIVLAIGLSVGYGIGIELWQSLLPTRYFSLGDAYANALGSLLITPWYVIHRYVEFRPLDHPARD